MIIALLMDLKVDRIAGDPGFTHCHLLVLTHRGPSDTQGRQHGSPDSGGRKSGP